MVVFQQLPGGALRAQHGGIHVDLVNEHEQARFCALLQAVAREAKQEVRSATSKYLRGVANVLEAEGRT